MKGMALLLCVMVKVIAGPIFSSNLQGNGNKNAILCQVPRDRAIAAHLSLSAPPAVFVLIKYGSVILSRIDDLAVLYSMIYRTFRAAQALALCLNRRANHIVLSVSAHIIA